ncbi:hypothetical protein N9W69_02545, partial [Flavobacteriaceae bacterium]|nr:hypothetical protein [Flavobacteriaceae bacterium]
MAASDKLFVIGIGGTGMRCLESFTYMCAMGMFDGKEINILTLDTDQLNGNKNRTENLIRKYIAIKDPEKKNDGGKPNNDTFFSAKLNLYSFWTDYNSSGRSKFKNIAQIHNDQDGDNKMLSELFLEESVQEFNLSHGYRAQTHLGSYLMYHAIVEAAKNLNSGKNEQSHEKEFGEFLQKIYDAGSEAKIFVFGSIFGGTGASSIPIIPKALNDALKVRDGEGKMGLDKNAKFGSTLLTEYFSFTKPDEQQKKDKENAVIADSSFFTLNSQAALQFYQGDPTVRKTYKRMYHIGWPIETEDFSKNKAEKKTITGGQSQKNKCHITEFLCACAAFDFFNTDTMDNDSAVYVHKSVRFKDNNMSFNFNDFIGDGERGKLFANKFAGFTALMHMVLGENKGAIGDNGIKGFLDRMSKQN